MNFKMQKTIGKMSKEKFQEWIIKALEEYKEFNIQCDVIGPEEVQVTLEYRPK